MKNKILLFILLLMAVSTLDNSLHKLQEFNQFHIYEINGQEIKVQVHQDGAALTLDGKGQAIVLNSMNINEYDYITRPIKSITIINAPESEVIEFENLHVPITVIDSPNSIIKNNQISSFDTTLYTYGILLSNSPNSEIAYNTIYNITSTSNSVSGIHLINSSGTIINNNTIEKITSTSSYFDDPRDVYGIRLHDSTDVPIIKARIKDLSSNGNGYGVFIDSSGRNKINQSHIKEINSKASYGVFSEDSQTMVINDTSILNLVSSSRAAYGISLKDGPDSEISLNHINTLDALLGEGCGVYLDSCTGTFIGNNTIQSLSSYSTTYGLCITASNSIEVEWNEISDLISSNSEAYGIFVDGSDILTVERNKISDLSPSYGLYFLECNHTTISENEVSNVQDWIYIDETSHDVQYSENTVDGQTLMLQIFNRPADIIVEEGNTSNYIVWSAVDPLAQSYSIFKDSEFVTSEPWASGEQIVHNLNYSLPMGQYSYKIILTESSGNQIVDVVKVSVIEMDLPQILSSPGDIYLSFGAPDQVLSWTLTDAYPATYSIYVNGTESVFDSWNSSEPITFNVSILGITEYTVFNCTLIASDSSGNEIIDIVLVFVFDIEIRTDMPAYIQYEQETTGQLLNLNWTVYSNESGFYIIYQDNGTISTIIDSGAFTPGEPILYQIEIDDLAVGVYEYRLVVGQDIENSVTVTVYANPDIPEAQEKTNLSRPHQPIPPYLAEPEANPWPTLIFGGFIVLGACLAGYWVITRHLMVPSAIKNEKKALKKARNVKDVHEEGKRLGAIGRIYFKAGDLKNAIKHHKEALERFKKTGEKNLQIKELESLGNAYLAQGVKEK